MINPYYVKDFAGINQIEKSFDSSYKHILSEHPDLCALLYNHYICSNRYCRWTVFKPKVFDIRVKDIFLL